MNTQGTHRSSLHRISEDAAANNYDDEEVYVNHKIIIEEHRRKLDKKFGNNNNNVNSNQRITNVTNNTINTNNTNGGNSSNNETSHSNASYSDIVGPQDTKLGVLSLENYQSDQSYVEHCHNLKKQSEIHNMEQQIHIISQLNRQTSKISSDSNFSQDNVNNRHHHHGNNGSGSGSGTNNGGSIHKHLPQLEKLNFNEYIRNQYENVNPKFNKLKRNSVPIGIKGGNYTPKNTCNNNAFLNRTYNNINTNMNNNNSSNNIPMNKLMV